MTDYSIRRRNRLAAEENDEAEAERYAELELEIEDRLGREHVEEFGPGIPYVRNGTYIHQLVMQRLEAERED